MDTEELQKLLNVATPGPWSLDGIAVAHSSAPHGYPIDICLMGEPAQYPGDIPVMMQKWESNARLIALAPTLARKVIAAEKLAEALEKLASYNEAIAADRMNYRPDDHTSVARAALAAWEAAQ